MKNILAKIRDTLAILSGIALVLYLVRVFKDSPLPDEDDFPLADEKAAAEKEASQIKEEIKEVGQKTYSDEEIEKRFNK